MESFPSQAEDAHRDERYPARFIEGILNKMCGVTEISATMASLAILGCPTEFFSESFWYVFVEEAIENAQRLCSEEDRKGKRKLDHCYQKNEETHSAKKRKVQKRLASKKQPEVDQIYIYSRFFLFSSI